jgi:hypothetical protein
VSVYDTSRRLRQGNNQSAVALSAAFALDCELEHASRIATQSIDKSPYSKLRRF